jgi:N-acetylneuraminate synthase
MKLVSFLNNYNPRVLHNPYVIAEAGVNHEGSMELAKRLIDEAAEGGAHAIKFQTYKAETIASKDSPYYWDITKEPTRSQFELFKKYDKFWKKEYEELARH